MKVFAPLVLLSSLVLETGAISDACKAETDAIQANTLFAVTRIALLAAGRNAAETCVSTPAVNGMCNMDLTSQTADFQRACENAGGVFTTVVLELECESSNATTTGFDTETEIPVCGGESCDFSSDSDFVESEAADFIDAVGDAVAADGISCESELDSADGSAANHMIRARMVLAVGIGMLAFLL